MSKNSIVLTISDLTVVKKERDMVPFLRRDKEGRSTTGFLVNNMNLLVSRNKIHGIVGESGSGKSLTMKCVLGLIDFSPGIISGNIKYMEIDEEIDILPKRVLKGNSKQWLSRLRSVLKKNNLLFRTEYFNVSREEPALELTHVPVSDSIQVYFVDEHKNCTQADFIPPTKLNDRLVRLTRLSDDNQIAVVLYSQISDFSSYRSKNWLDKIQQNAQIRGKRISMILQDPQTFLNPYWSIEKQLKNIIKNQREKVKDSLYFERNFTLRIVGSRDDFPVCVKWDADHIKRYLRQADIWLDGKSYSMLSAEEAIIESGSSHFMGFNIDEEEHNSSVLSHGDIRSPVDILTAEATLTITPKYDQDYVGNISLQSASNNKRDLEFGLLSSATEGEDKHLGEKDISATLQEGIFEAGFIIGQEEDEIFSPKDFRNLRAEMDINTEVSSLLSKVDLDDEDKQFRKLYPREVSGGQGQRVMISLAMAAKPEVLIADEPTTGLDVTKQTEIVQLFRQYKNQGRTIILISHDLNFVSHLADYYTIIYAGTDIEHMPNDVLNSKETLHPYTKQLLEIARSEQSAGFSFIEKDIPDPYRSDFAGCPFEPRCKAKDKITESNGKHLCKSLLPPMINVDSGEIVEDEQMKNKEHYSRCWLFLKTQ